VVVNVANEPELVRRELVAVVVAAKVVVVALR